MSGKMLLGHLRKATLPREKTYPRLTKSDGLQKDGQARSLPKPATDIQAILTVLGRRKAGHEKEGQELDLTKTDLRGVDLSETHLERVHLSDAHLEGALLWEAYLEKADLTGVVGLTKEQIESAIMDENTKLSDYLTEAMKSEAK
jgi:hypothetical protein